MSRRDSKAPPTKKNVCCGTSAYHRHCVICRGRLRPDQRLFCGEACRDYDKRERRLLRSVDCWIEPRDGSTPRRRAWIPRSVFAMRHNLVCAAPEARRATQGQGA
jgi:predicted nucleic acid-binding Zn ribbon protein